MTQVIIYEMLEDLLVFRIGTCIPSLNSGIMSSRFVNGMYTTIVCIRKMFWESLVLGSFEKDLGTPSICEIREFVIFVHVHHLSI